MPIIEEQQLPTSVRAKLALDDTQLWDPNVEARALPPTLSQLPLNDGTVPHAPPQKMGSKASHMRALLAEGKGAREIAEKVGTSPAYVYVLKSQMKRKEDKAVTSPRVTGGLLLRSDDQDEDALLQSIRKLGVARSKAILAEVEELETFNSKLSG